MLTATPMESSHARLNWVGNGFYQVAAVGTSNYREALRILAQNPPGTSALAQCTAELVPEADNPHDPNAIVVRIDGATVGHLSRATAEALRNVLASAGVGNVGTFASAVVSNGLVTPEREYSYTVELDLLLDGARLGNAGHTSDATVQLLLRWPSLERQPDGAFTAKIWLPVSSHSELHKGRGVKLWTTESWDTVNFYADNFKRIGLGHKVLEVPKPKYLELFGTTEVAGRLEELDGRWATLHVRLN